MVNKTSSLSVLTLSECREIRSLVYALKECWLKPYQVGQLIIHSGHTIHQAAPGKNIQPDDERITLQGHGIFSQGSWQLYW